MAERSALLRVFRRCCKNRLGASNAAGSEREAADARSYIVGSFAGARETPQDLVEDLWRIEVEELPTDYYDRYLEKIAGVAPDKTVGVVGELVQRDQLVIVVVGPADVLKKQLANIADVEVVPAYEKP